MIFHQPTGFYTLDQPQDQPVATCSRCVNQAKPKKISIAQYDAKEVWEDAKNKPRHGCTHTIRVHFHRFFQMCVRSKGFPLNAELDCGERFASKNHPRNSMN